MGDEDLVLRVLGSGMAWLGFAFGCIVGVAFQKLRSSTTSYRTTKALVPVLRKGMLANLRRFAVLLVIVVIGGLLTLGWWAGQRGGDAIVPASVPSTGVTR